MLALRILDLKDFTGKLFIGEMFQHFSFVEASFTTFVTYTLDGQLHKEFFDSEQKPMRTYCLWEDVQAQCFSIIKGKRTPLNFKIVFQLSSPNVEKLLSQSGIALKPEDIYGLYLNCQFDGKQLLCTTGTSLKIFTLDKQLDRVWDEMVRKFFRKNQVAFEDAYQVELHINRFRCHSLIQYIAKRETLCIEFPVLFVFANRLSFCQPVYVFPSLCCL